MGDSIFERSPWNIKEERFKRIKSRFQIKNTLEFIKQKHRFLSIHCDGAAIPMKSVLLKISNDTLLIDKPIDWQNSPEKLRIYFRDHYNTWNFIRAELENEGIYHLSLNIPREIYRLECRWHKRVQLKSEARARFRYEDHSQVELQILNLSASGMLVCSGSKEETNRINTSINTIAIDIKDNSTRQAATVIDQGIVVRSYQDKNSGCVCHGITFIHKDKNSLESLHNLIN